MDPLLDGGNDFLTHNSHQREAADDPARSRQHKVRAVQHFSPHKWSIKEVTAHAEDRLETSPPDDLHKVWPA